MESLGRLPITNSVSPEEESSDRRAGGGESFHTFSHVTNPRHTEEGSRPGFVDAAQSGAPNPDDSSTASKSGARREGGRTFHYTTHQLAALFKPRIIWDHRRRGRREGILGTVKINKRLRLLD